MSEVPLCTRRFAFDYLDDLQKEFVQLHGQQIDSVRVPSSPGREKSTLLKP